MRNVCWIIAAVCLFLRSAAARDVYVDNLAGDDKNIGLHAQNQGDTTGPVRTIAKALRLARAGDRVLLAKSDEPYRECVALVGNHHSGAARLLPFILEGNGATLDGTAAIPADGWKHFRANIFRFRPKSSVEPLLFFGDRAIPPLPLAAATAVPPKLEPLQWCAIEGAIYFAVEGGKLPPDYKLSYAEMPTGITLYQVEQVVIRNLTIRGYRVDGVAAAVGARNIVLDNVTCTANGLSGVSVRGGAQVELESCKLAGNGLAQLLTRPNSETHLLASDLLNDSARGWVDQGGRVYLGAKRIEGGRKAIKAEDAPKPEAKEVKKAVEKGDGNDS